MAAKAIPNSFQILQAVIEATPDAIFVKDLDGRYVLVNEAAARFLGKAPKEIVGKNDLELYTDETARHFIEDDRQVLATGTAHVFQGVATGESSTQAYLVTKGVYRDRDGKTLGLFGISHDMTELREAQTTLEQTREALFRSQKMEAVGQLTGGISHDFNNILAIILGNAELLRAYLPKDKYADELIEQILRATFHGRDLTSHLLAFSGRRVLNPQPVEINGLVESVVRLFARTLGAQIRVATELSERTSVAFIDPSALEAALLNVALNGRDAMPDGGTLTLRTSRVDLNSGAAIDAELAPGAYATIEIVDTGVGMSREVTARVFEPFFTTKTGGRGTGLGLSMVYGFAKQSGGSATIDSAEGRGTTVTIFLPVIGKEVTAVARRSTRADTSNRTARTVLVVENEADVRNMVRRQLESLGHRVLTAEGATEALLIVQSPGAPDVLLTDVMLATGMNGVDLANAARDARPGLPVIFMSGFTAAPDAQRRIREIGSPLLSKPFTASQVELALNVVCGDVA